MPLNPEALEKFQQSLERAKADAVFWDRFYDRFMSMSDEIKAIFRHKNMDRIKRKLGTTLDTAALSAKNTPGFDMYLELLGKTHERLNIPNELFIYWREALIATAAESDPRFNAAAEAAWREVLDGMISHMHGTTPESGRAKTPGTSAT